MKSRFSKILVSYGIPLFIGFAAVLFSQSAPYWGWHLVHGFHTEISGVRLWVPLPYRAAEITPQRSLALMRYQGIFPSPSDQLKAGIMMVDFVESNKMRSPLEIGLGTGPITLNAEEPYHKKSEREATMAGRKGQCVEYANNLEPSASNLVDRETIKVYCWFGNDLRASFLGDSFAERKFFEIIESARQEKGRR